MDETELGYELGCHWHLGAIAAGPGGLHALRDLAARFDRRLLLVRPADGAVWAWLGGRKAIPAEAVASAAASTWPAEAVLTLGEPAHGIAGWRLTHRQALAALSIADREAEKVICYRDVALLAAALHDDVLSSSLNEIYLAPLAEEHDGGAVSRQTLRAYFAAQRNVSSAAAVLAISPNTVSSRLRAIEDKIERPLDTCAAEMETALRLQRLSDGQIR